VFINFTDTFPAVWLPQGTYYLVLYTEGALPIAWEESGLGPFNGPPSLPVLIGTVGPAFNWFAGFQQNGAFPEQLPLGQVCAFDLEGPIIGLPPVGGGIGQLARFVAGPITPPIGGPVEAQIGFANAETGALLGPLQQVTLNPGQVASADLNLTPFISRIGQRIEVQPVIVQSPTATGAVSPGPIQISGSVQVLDAVTGFGTTLAPVGRDPGPNGLGAQILAGGQTMRFDIFAAGTDPCVAQVAFYDKNGNALMPSVPVHLASGTGTTVDLNADALGFKLGQEIEVQPTITPTAPATAVPQNSACNASVEVFDHLTGRTWSHQDALVGLPAVQTPAGGAPGTPSSATSTQ
jgi:hypothetical protein